MCGSQTSKGAIAAEHQSSIERRDSDGRFHVVPRCVPGWDRGPTRTAPLRLPAQLLQLGQGALPVLRKRSRLEAAAGPAAGTTALPEGPVASHEPARMKTKASAVPRVKGSASS